jgi:queuine tRNA-ribosyltransferase
MTRAPYTLLAASAESRARLGRIETAHGPIDTPQFCPVATQGTVRAQRTSDVAAAGGTLLLANTWHLAQRPGLDVFDAVGGLHGWMRWPGAVLTDSGGFQAYSLHADIDEDGATITQPDSGKRLRLTPESSIDAQRRIGADIAMVFDHCVPSTVPRPVAEDAMRRTHRWAARSLAARGDGPMACFAIVQGAVHADLRRESARTLTELPFDGFAIGGLAVGEGKSEREDMTAEATALLPHDRPRYLMGVGTPLDLLEGVHRGVDLFDCILPTAMAQRGRAYTRLGRVELRRAVYATQQGPLDPDCCCPVCREFSRSYLRHLFDAEEPLAWTLLGQHNLHFYLDLMRDVRAALRDGTFATLYADRRAWLDAPDREHPPTPPVARRRRGPLEERGAFAIHATPAFGDQPASWSIRDRASGEVMHSVSAPDAEARRLYVEQPRLAERAREDGGPLVVWDVGLGAGTNAMEVVRAWEQARADGATRALHLVSFERDLDALRLAFAHRDRFTRLRHGGPAAILERCAWEGPGIRWELRMGDVPDTIDGGSGAAPFDPPPAPDVILWDPFSFKVDAPLWQPPALRRVRATCTRPAALYTYTNSTAARLALLEAGFYVGSGVGTGPKSETTIAWSHSPGAGEVRALLGPAFLEKWARSSKRWPDWVEPEERMAYEARLRAHPQWTHAIP